MELKKPIIDGLLLGVAGGMSLGGLKRIANRISDQRSLSKLHKIVKKELAKRDVELEGSLFRDANPNYEEKKAAIDLNNMPAWAALLSSAGIGAGLGLYTSNMFENKDKESTPYFATKYKKLKEQKFKRAAKLLRAVTDPVTMREHERKREDLTEKDASWLPWLAGAYGLHKANQGAHYAGDKLHELADALRETKDEVLKPLAITGGIAALGGLGLYGVNKLLRRQAEDKSRQSASKNAINAWLANRKETADADREINAFVQRSDAAERRELNEILNAYEARYQKKKKEKIIHR